MQLLLVIMFLCVEFVYATLSFAREEIYFNITWININNATILLKYYLFNQPSLNFVKIVYFINLFIYRSNHRINKIIININYHVKTLIQ